MLSYIGTCGKLHRGCRINMELLQRGQCIVQYSIYMRVIVYIYIYYTYALVLMSKRLSHSHYIGTLITTYHIYTIHNRIYI